MYRFRNKEKFMPQCPECENYDGVIKFGKPRGKQRYLCTVEWCKKGTFTTTDEYKSSGAGKWHSALFKIQTCNKYREMNKEGISLRKAANILGISHTSLSRWEADYWEIKSKLTGMEEFELSESERKE
jgi:transposase-like protein